MRLRARQTLSIYWMKNRKTHNGMKKANHIIVGDTLNCDRVVVRRTDSNSRDLGEIRTIDGKEYMCYPVEHHPFTITFVDDKRYDLEKVVEIAKKTRKDKRSEKILAVGVSTDFMPKDGYYVRAMCVSAEEVLDRDLLESHINEKPQTMWFRTYGMCSDSPDIPRCAAPVEII